MTVYCERLFDSPVNRHACELLDQVGNTGIAVCFNNIVNNNAYIIALVELIGNYLSWYQLRITTNDSLMQWEYNYYLYRLMTLWV